MILVTGATGFLGSELVKQLLHQNQSVRALKRETSLIPAFLKHHQKIDWVTADVLDYFSLEEAFDGIDQVYHCAALISFNASDRKEMLRINGEGTSHVVNLCLEKNIKLLHVSSVAAVGSPKLGELITENNHWEYDGKQSGYAISKYVSEMEVFRGIAEGLEAVIVNPSVIIGKNSGTKGSGAFFQTIKNGLSYYPSGSCGLVDVEDVAECMINLMASKEVKERFIINAENLSYKDFFTLIASEFKVKPPGLEAKPWMMRLASFGSKIASAFSNKGIVISNETVRIASKQFKYSNDKIIKAINVQFKPIKQSVSEICSLVP